MIKCTFFSTKCTFQNKGNRSKSKISTFLFSLFIFFNTILAKEPCEISNPENFRVVTKSSTWISLKWNHAPGAVSYLIHVYNSETKELIQSNVVSNTEIEIFDLKNSNLFDFQIHSICIGNIPSTQSSWIIRALTLGVELKPQKIDPSDGTISETDPNCNISNNNDYCNFHNINSDLQKILIKSNSPTIYGEFYTSDELPFISSTSWRLRINSDEGSTIKIENSFPESGDYIMVKKNEVEIVKLFPIQSIDLPQAGIQGQFIDNQNNELYIKFFHVTPSFDRKKNIKNIVTEDAIEHDPKYIGENKLEIYNISGQKIIEDLILGENIDYSNYDLISGFYIAILKSANKNSIFKFFHY
jgi:hypothetical protein